MAARRLNNYININGAFFCDSRGGKDGAKDFSESSYIDGDD
jgi:hypothetical protein